MELSHNMQNIKIYQMVPKNTKNSFYNIGKKEKHVGNRHSKSFFFDNLYINIIIKLFMSIDFRLCWFFVLEWPPIL